MALDKLVDSTQLDSDLTSVANAIRTKGGTSASLEFPGDFVTAIGNISGGGTLGTKTVTENGTYDAEDDNLDGYSQVTVNVPPFSFYQEVEYLTIGSSLTYITIPYDCVVGDIFDCSVSCESWTDRNSMAVGGVKDSIGSSSGYRANITVQDDNGTRKKTLYANAGSVADYDDPSITSSNGAVVKYGSAISAGDKVHFKAVFGTAANRRVLEYGAWSTSEFVTGANLYKLTLSDSSNNKKIELIPCYRKSDNLCGFYDTQSGKFYSANEGTFTAGPNVASADQALSILLGE